MAGPFYRRRQLPLVFGARACDATGNDFSSVGNKAAQTTFILVINVLNFIVAKSTRLPATPSLMNPYFFPSLSNSRLPHFNPL